MNDLPAVWEATNHVFSRAGVTPLTLDEFRAEFTLPFKVFYDRFLPDIPMEQLETWFHGHFEKVRDSVDALPTARRFLEFCRDRGLRLFVLSTVQETHFQRQADLHAFSPFFEKCYLGVNDKRLRILAILEENRLHPSSTLFVGDMTHDIETARHGKVASCAVLTGYNRLGQLRAARPDLIVEHLGELLEVLTQNDLSLPANHDLTGRTQGTRPVATVGALIFDPQGRLLMIQTQKWSHRWGIPGGKIHYGEPSLDALRREVREETGLEIDEIRLEMVQDCIASQEFYQEAHFLLLNYTCRCREPAKVQLNEEACAYRWVTWEEAYALPLNQPTRLLLDTVQRRMDSADAPKEPIPHVMTPPAARQD